MKFYSVALLLVTLTSSASAFSAVAPGSKVTTAAASAPSVKPIDRTLEGIDDSSVFDPTSGESPAVTRNNKDEVWVSQVRYIFLFFLVPCRTHLLTQSDRSGPGTLSSNPQQRARPRRNRKSPAMRGMVRENIVTPSNFIYPLFIHDEDFNTPIPSMPGCERNSLDSMLSEVGESMELGVRTFVLFPKVADELKTNLGVEAYNPEGIVPRAIRMIKAAYPDATVVTDVALDPYSDQGHDGVVEDGKILNDVTITQLCKQAVCQARAGCDIVAPSDMMVSVALLLGRLFAKEQRSFLIGLLLVCQRAGRSCQGDP